MMIRSESWLPSASTPVEEVVVSGLAECSQQFGVHRCSLGRKKIFVESVTTSARKRYSVVRNREAPKLRTRELDAGLAQQSAMTRGSAGARL